jgi:hypothetical protein
MRLLALGLGCGAILVAALAACESTVETEDHGVGGSGAGSGAQTGFPSNGGATKGTTGSSGAGCPSALWLSGTHLLTVSVKLNPQKAFALNANIEVTEGPSSLNGSMALQPLSAMDQQTPVCAPLSFENLPVSADGSFVWNLGQVSICGEANPISGSELVTTLILEGAFCSAPHFACGNVSGIVTAPLPDFDLTGSTFTLQKYPSQIPAPLINCNMDPAQY